MSGEYSKDHQKSKEDTMPGRSPAGPLMAEHRVIERMLAVLERQLGVIAETRTVEPGLIDTATDFIRTYADHCHHGKEEDILFRRLADKPLDDELAEVMTGLIEDHVRGRSMTRRLIEANSRYRSGESTALSEIESCIQELVDFYPVHIAKEDRHFFKPCLEYFTDTEKQAMLADFDEFDRALIHEKYRGVVEDLEQASS
jgi:hemerythrin-like domain-containing protein